MVLVLAIELDMLELMAAALDIMVLKASDALETLALKASADLYVVF